MTKRQPDVACVACGGPARPARSGGALCGPVCRRRRKNEQSRAWRDRNPEQVKLAIARWRKSERGRHKTNVRRRRRYAMRPDKIRASNRAFFRAYFSTQDGRARIYELQRQYRRRVVVGAHDDPLWQKVRGAIFDVWSFRKRNPGLWRRLEMEDRMSPLQHVNVFAAIQLHRIRQSLSKPMTQSACFTSTRGKRRYVSGDAAITAPERRRRERMVREGAILTPEKVIEIRWALMGKRMQGDMDALARKHGVARQTIRDIHMRRTWVNV